MPRPTCCRRIGGQPGAVLFKPAGIPARELEQVVLQLDELEAVRLADLEGLYHADAAERMNVSRQTFGRVLESARRKIASALVNGTSILINGGVVLMSDMRTFVCSGCKAVWQLPHGGGCPKECPECKSTDIHRDPEECKKKHEAEPNHGHKQGGCCCRKAKQNV